MSDIFGMKSIVEIFAEYFGTNAKKHETVMERAFHEAQEKN